MKPAWITIDKRTMGRLIPAGLMLLIGGSIYLLMRSPILVLHEWVRKVGLGTTMDTSRHLVEHIHLPAWVIYCLPGALWAAAYILLIDLILAQSHAARSFLEAAFIPLLGISSEAMQYAGLLPGTFDALDLTAYALPLLAYALWTFYFPIPQPINT